MWSYEETMRPLDGEEIHIAMNDMVAEQLHMQWRYQMQETKRLYKKPTSGQFGIENRENSFTFHQRNSIDCLFAKH